MRKTTRVKVPTIDPSSTRATNSEVASLPTIWVSSSAAGGGVELDS
jgi:hypothetical protein